MTVLRESHECYIQQCNECGAVLKYSLHDIHIANETFFIDDQPWVASYDTIVCPCCKRPLVATKNWFYDVFLPQKFTTTQEKLH